MRFNLALFSLFAFLPCTVSAGEPERDYANIGICSNLFKLRDMAANGFESIRGDVIGEGITPYDSASSNYTKTRYHTDNKILFNADNCEIWEADNPDIYHKPRYTCHWNASYAEERAEKFLDIYNVFDSCFNIGEYMCFDVYGDRRICFLKNIRTGGTLIEWGEGVSKQENDQQNHFVYFNIYEKTNDQQN